ncbi:MAG: SUMF1/EgtB/PvdO family nonheme iron enzyme [Planctomycetes bacterium]|nr:SUMF1/EgtB/PvdO family nonheme iron enzyme [Planctomycetota bacterium]
MRRFTCAGVVACLICSLVANTKADDAKKPEVITNSIGMKLALIPAGEFQMGSPEGEPNHTVLEKQHRVRLTRPFYIGVYTVTQAEYTKVMGNNPSFFSATGKGKDKVAGLDTSRFPVEDVSWESAVEFCKKLSKLDHKTYRLPTEAEWEYACRAGTTTTFNFGDSCNGTEANCKGDQYPLATSTKGPYLGRPCPVGSYKPNAFGLYDMHGNVSQWCLDRFDTMSYSKYLGDDPVLDGDGNEHVDRGGNWQFAPVECRAAHRYGMSPDRNRPGETGFRVVIQEPAPAIAKTEPAKEAKPRLWHDASGKYSIKAVLVEVKDGVATIERSDDGTTLQLPVDKLSDADQRYLKTMPVGTPLARARPPAKPLHLETITNAIGMKMVLIPPGDFQMGSPADEIGRADNETQHWVRITRPFFMGAYPVTQGEFLQIMGFNRSNGGATLGGTPKGEDPTHYPVRWVFWPDANEFCKKLSEKEGKHYRLPTEAEWEYACRAGTLTPFNWGSTADGTQANQDGNRPYGTTTKGPHIKHLTPVGSYKPNAFGLYDMHGNITQWCQDFWEDNYYSHSPVDDPQGPKSGSMRIYRGGRGDPLSGRSAVRRFTDEINQFLPIGFRVVMDKEPRPKEPQDEMEDDDKPAAPRPRLWRDVTGKHNMEATMVTVNKDSVTLRRAEGGKLVTLKLDKLSEADRAHVAYAATQTEKTAQPKVTAKGKDPALKIDAKDLPRDIDDKKRFFKEHANQWIEVTGIVQVMHMNPFEGKEVPSVLLCNLFDRTKPAVQSNLDDSRRMLCLLANEQPWLQNKLGDSMTVVGQVDPKGHLVHGSIVSPPAEAPPTYTAEEFAAAYNKEGKSFLDRCMLEGFIFSGKVTGYIQIDELTRRPYVQVGSQQFRWTPTEDEPAVGAPVLLFCQGLWLEGDPSKPELSLGARIDLLSKYARRKGPAGRNVGGAKPTKAK